MQSKKPARTTNHLLKIIVGVLLVSLFAFIPNGTASADIFKSPKLDVISDGGVTIGPEYTFVPKVTSATKIVPFGSTLWRDTTWSDSDARKFKSIELTNPTNRDSLKGNIGVRYTNVGTYNGTSIDLKITVTNWSRWGQAGKVGTAARVGNISFEHKQIAMSTQGYSFVDVTWEYVKTGTNTRVAVSGYFTFSDIDVYQGLQFSPTTSTNIRGIMVENRQNYLEYLNSGGQYRYYDIRDIDILDTKYDSRYAFTFLYSRLSSFSLRWMTDWSKTKSEIRGGRLVTPDRYYYLNTTKYASGEYLFFVINKPSATIVPDPVKTVNKTTGWKAAEPLIYKITHDVPQEDPKFYHTSYVFTDTLDTVIPSPKLVITNSAGTNVTSWFTVAVSGSKVTATAKAATLKNANFYGDTYDFTITGTPNTSTLATKVGAGTSYVIKNKASVKTNKGTYTTNEVKTTIAKRTLTVRHIDDETNAVIATNTETVFDGETYSKTPRTDLKKGTLFYKPTSTVAQKGTINGKNVTLDFRYTLPSLDIGIDKIQIYTDKVTSSGLRTIVELSKNLPTGANAADFSGSVKLDVVDTTNANKVAYTKVYPIGSLPDKLEFKLPADYLTKGKKTNYDFRLSVVAGSSGLISKTPSVKTYGYSSSEKKFTNADLASGVLNHTGVIMTEKAAALPVKDFNETLNLTIPKLAKQKTGYGFNTTVDSIYTNDLKNLVDVKTGFKINAKLIDTFLDYPVASGVATVPMERTINKKSVDGKTVTAKLELPKVHVERYSGNLFTPKQVADKDARIKHEALDGGRKLYVPLWVDLGDYNYAFASTEAVGVHAVTFDFADKLNLYAYMFNYSESPTTPDDELLVHPMEKADMPSDWELGAPEK